MRRTLTISGATLFLLCTVAACASPPSHEPPDGAPLLLTASQPAEATREAAITGVLEIRDDCFVLTGDQGDWLVQWPYGSTLGEDRESVNVPDFGTVHVGDTVDAGGGYGENRDCDADGVQGTASIDTLE